MGAPGYKKILAIKLRALGDTVLATAPLQELRKAYPNAQLHFAVLSPWGALLNGHPSVDRLWSLERHTDAATRAKTLASNALKLRREHFDLVVNFHASPSSSLLSFATGAKTRSIHFHGHRHKNRYSTVTVPGKGTLKPIIERDMDALRALGLHVPAGRLPSIPLPSAEKTHAHDRLIQQGLQTPDGRGKILGLGLGSSRPTKSWPVERFAALAIEWCRDPQSTAIAVAGPNEDQLIHQFWTSLDDTLQASIHDTQERAAIRKRIGAEQGLPIRQVAALLSQLTVFAGNDSGPRHVAVAVGTPTVTLFGPEDPFEWHPYPPAEHPFLYLEGLPCRKDADPGKPPFCALHECVVEQHKCLRGIGVNAVIAECRRVASLKKDLVV